MVDAVLELPNDLIHELLHLEQRWNNRVLAQGPFAKPYLEGRLSVVVEFESKRGPEEDAVFAVYQESGSLGRLDQLAPVWAEDLQAINPGQVNGRIDQLVFVSHVKVMDGIEKAVPSVVRLKRSKQVDDIWSGPVYCSTFNHCLKVFGSFGEWEVDTRHAASVVSHHVTGHEIERGPQIVDGISDNEGPVIGLGMTLKDAQELISGLGLEVHDHYVGVFSGVDQNFPVQVSDVLIGPLNF